MNGLAIAGGGLKCIAQLGALKALNELNIKFDIVSGTSSGSMIASMYAMDCTYEEMRELVKNYHKKFTKFSVGKLSVAAMSFLTTGIAKVDGIIDANELQNLIRKLANSKGVTSIKDTNLPLVIISVDTITAKEAVFCSLPKKEQNFENGYIYINDIPIDYAIRASTAFPGLFQTCTYEKYNFIDGGTKNNLPTEPLKALGAEKILALTFELDEYKPKKDLLSILLRTCDIFSYDKVELSKKVADLSVNIAVPGASLLTVDNFDDTCMIGYNAIMEKKEEIIRLFG